jgi:glycerol-3-phosphate dehydrogenase
LTADGHFFTAAPCGELHYLGPTETPYAGDPSEAHASEDDIALVLALAAEAMPSAQLARSDVLAAWAGVRPVTHSDEMATGRHERVIHDLSDRGAPNMLTLTWGRLVDHRDTARQLVAAVRKKLAPSRARRSAPAHDRVEVASEPNASLDVRLEAGRVESMALREHVVHLDDILFRRASLGWRPELDEISLRNVALAAARVLDWDASQLEAELARCAQHRRSALGMTMSQWEDAIAGPGRR